MASTANRIEPTNPTQPELPVAQGAGLELPNHGNSANDGNRNDGNKPVDQVLEMTRAEMAMAVSMVMGLDNKYIQQLILSGVNEKNLMEVATVRDMAYILIAKAADEGKLSPQDRDEAVKKIQMDAANAVEVVKQAINDGTVPEALKPLAEKLIGKQQAENIEKPAQQSDAVITNVASLGTVDTAKVAANEPAHLTAVEGGTHVPDGNAPRPTPHVKGVIVPIEGQSPRSL